MSQSSSLLASIQHSLSIFTRLHCLPEVKLMDRDIVHDWRHTMQLPGTIIRHKGSHMSYR